jgi:AcrR family transcriptional regulator
MCPVASHGIVRAVEATTTLRERKKAATRHALHEAVLRLAIAHGLDAVTVDAIAEEANVSKRTFSNYFANKEDALLYGDRLRVEALLDEIRSRPPRESAWEALTRGTATRYERLDQVDPGWLAQLQLIRRHPSLLAQQHAAQAALERELAQEIIARLPDPSIVHARIMAATFLATLRTVHSMWIEDPAPTPLSAAVLNGLTLASERFP